MSSVLRRVSFQAYVAKDFRALDHAWVCVVAALLSLAVVGMNRVEAQGDWGTISGTASDTSGSVLVGARIQVKDVETGNTRSMLTDSLGRYRFPDLPIGSYEVQASMQNFHTVIHKGIVLTIGGQPVVDFSMPVGQRVEMVEVPSQVSQVETQSAAVSSLVNPSQMHDLPLNGRDFEQFLTLAPGIQALPAMPAGGMFTPSFYGTGQNYSVSGSRPEGELFLLDNTNITNFWQHGTGAGSLGTSLGVDAIQEFQVLTGTYSAQFAGNGAVINAVSKSGTNTFHGSGYEFLRNSVFDAKNYFDLATTPIPPFRRNQFGGTIGGPVKKDKLFFFFNYEGFRQSQGQTGVAYVLDPQARTGLLPCNTVPFPVPGYPCTNGVRIPLSALGASINPTIENILTQPSGPYNVVYPQATGPELLVQGGPYNGYPTGYAGYSPVASNVGNEDYLLGRIDYNISGKDSLFFRYVSDNSHAFYPFTGSGLPDWPEADHGHNQFFTAEERHIFSPTLVTSAQFNFVRTYENALSPDQPPPASDPLNFAQVFAPGQGRYDGTVSPGAGGSTLGPASTIPFTMIQNKFTGGEDLIWIHGAHNLKIGVYLTRVQANLSVPWSEGTEYQFGGPFFLLEGSPNVAFSVPANNNNFIFTAPNTTPPPYNTWRYFRQTDIDPYIQDDWKVTRRLTVSAGIRLDYVTNPTQAGGVPLYNVLDFATSTGYTQVPNVFKSNPNANNWDPRVGLAYDPFNDHKTSIRAGFGIFHDQVDPRAYGSEYWMGPPSSTLILAPVAFPNPYVEVSACNPSVPATCQPPNELAGVDYDLKYAPYMIQYEFSIQREIARGAVLSVGYIGSQGVHLLTERNGNPPMCSPAPGSTTYSTDCSSLSANFWSGLSINPATGDVAPGIPIGNIPIANPAINLNSPNASITSAAATGHSSYNSLQVALNRQFTGNVQGQVSYTWSKCLDDGSVTSGQENQTAVQSGESSSPYNQSLDRGPCDMDIRNSLRVNSLIALPFHGNRAVEGWQWSEILSVTSGFPLNMLDGFNQSLMGNLADIRPNYADGVACNRVIGKSWQWFDPACYTLAPPGQLGDVGRNSVTGPGVLNLDTAVHKNTKLTEKLTMQLRAEFFNVLNRPNFGEPNTDVFSGSFGQDTSSPQTYNPAAGQITYTSFSSRQIQFALKFMF